MVRGGVAKWHLNCRSDGLVNVFFIYPFKIAFKEPPPPLSPPAACGFCIDP